MSTDIKKYHHQQNKGTPEVVYLPISKLHSILVRGILLVHDNLWLYYAFFYW